MEYNAALQKMGTPTMKAYTILVLTFTYAAVFWAVFAAKCAVEGFGEVMRYFTNWTFFITSLYFTAEFLAYFPPPRFQQGLRLCFWWMVFGQNVLVFCLVFLMMLNNYSIVEKLTDKNGGDYTLGEVMDLEKLFHVIPTLLLFYMCVINRTELKRAMCFVVLLRERGAGALASLVIIYHIASGTFMAILFQLAFGFNETYGTTIPVGLGLLAVLMIILLFVCPIYYELFPSVRFAFKHAPARGIVKAPAERV